MQKNKIKLFGERNTGTNYLSQLIKKNLNVMLLRGNVPNYITFFQKAIPYNDETFRDLYFSKTKKYNLGWKHAYVSSNLLNKSIYDKDDILIITITKNPYSWLLSLFRRPHYSNYWLKNKGLPSSFTEFLSHNWHSLKRENTPNAIIENPIKLWDIKNGSYLKFAEDKRNNVLHVKYEDLLFDFQNIIVDIANRYGIEIEHSEIENIENSSKGDANKFADYKKYYLQEQWREKLKKIDIELINQYLDPHIMQTFDYTYI